MKTLGIDPGIQGGLAIVEHSGDATVLIDAIDVPVIGTGAKERVNVLAIRLWIGRHRPTVALIERAQAMPKQGASSGFKYGRAAGSLEATLALCEIPIQIVEPSVWKRAFRLPGKDKEAARQCALQLFPASHALLTRKRDHGRAEAGLIAFYGICNSRLTMAPTDALDAKRINQISVNESA